METTHMNTFNKNADWRVKLKKISKNETTYCGTFSLTYYMRPNNPSTQLITTGICDMHSAVNSYHSQV